MSNNRRSALVIAGVLALSLPWACECGRPQGSVPQPEVVVGRRDPERCSCVVVELRLECEGITITDVSEFLARVTPAGRRRDAEALLRVYARATGLEPQLWGTIIGFGQYHYRYASGREGDGPAAGFAPRKTATSIYLADGIGAHATLLPQLGPCTTGQGCLYLKDLSLIDLGVLEQIVRASYTTLTAGTYTLRARDTGRLR